MDHHRIDADSVNTLREIARASDLMDGVPIEERAVTTSAPIAVLRDLRDRDFITVLLGLQGKACATLTARGRHFLAHEADDAKGGQRPPSRTLVGAANYAFGF